MKRLLLNHVFLDQILHQFLVENNEDLKKMRDSIDFMTDLQTGKISVEMVKEDSKIEEVKKESDNIDGEHSIKKNYKKPS